MILQFHSSEFQSDAAFIFHFGSASSGEKATDQKKKIPLKIRLETSMAIPFCPKLNVFPLVLINGFLFLQIFQNEPLNGFSILN